MRFSKFLASLTRFMVLVCKKITSFAGMKRLAFVFLETVSGRKVSVYSFFLLLDPR
jgi:hypothetical protein